MNTSLTRWLIYVISVILVIDCGNNKSIYEGIENRSMGKTLAIEKLVADSVFCPGLMTSMTGQWCLRDAELIYLDRYIVGIKHFSLEGEFLGETVSHGRGPGEVLGTAWSSTWSEEEEKLYVNDSNLSLQVFDNRDSLMLYTEYSWILLMDNGFDANIWKNRMKSPDLTEPQIYDYNFNCEKICSYKGYLYFPVIAEHPKINGYETGHGAKKYWKEAGTLISFSPDSISSTIKLMGAYPEIYRRKNIPVFATYDFFVLNESIHIAFAADPRIFVTDLNGNPLYSYGEAADGVKLVYPQTSTINEYDRVFESQRLKYGHYCRLSKAGGYVFRTLLTDSGQWLMQVYKDDTLIKVLDCGSDLKIIGYRNGYFFADAGADFKKERFVIIKFKI